jgi:hypothetical protein
MNRESNVKVTVVIPADADLHLLDAVLERVNGQDTEIAIQLEQPKDLQSQISDWLAATYGIPA